MVSLLSTLLLAGWALAAPVAQTSTAASTATCSERSASVRDWTVVFDYHASYVFTTPAHQNSWGYVNFSLGNPALNYTANCTAQSSQLQDFFYGTVNYACTVPPGAGEASFSFSRPTGELKVNQTWYCPAEGSRFTAKGSGTLKLDCEDKTWQNPDWPQEPIYSSRTITCKTVTAAVPITEMSAVA